MHALASHRQECTCQHELAAFERRSGTDIGATRAVSGLKRKLNLTSAQTALPYVDSAAHRRASAGGKAASRWQHMTAVHRESRAPAEIAPASELKRMDALQSILPNQQAQV